MEDCSEKWRYGVPREEQPRLQPLLDGLERLRSRCLTAAVVVAAFHRRRVLPLMARRRRLFDMRLDEPIEGIRMSAAALAEEAVLCRVRETVDRKMKSGGLTHIVMRPSWGYLSLVSHASLQPPSPLCFSSFLVPLCTFVVPAGDEGRTSLPAARSRGHEAAGDQPGTRRGIEKVEGRHGGEAHKADSCARETR